LLVISPMNFLIRILFLSLPLIAAGQYSTGNLRTIGRKKAEFVLTPDSLARQLTANYKTDREKVTSIFRWITENISYNVRPFYNSTHNPSTAFEMDGDDTGSLKSLSERVAMDVLSRRIAFCDGYSRLFTTLCAYAGIKSEVITGYASSNYGSRRFGSNHRWNAVYLDSSWQLLDATWAAGHLTYGSDDFIRNYNNFYFLTPAEEFSRDHYPEDLQWTLLSNPPDRSEFRYSPFRTNGYVKNNIRSYSPSTGVIEASQGDTLYFELETTGEKKNMVVLDTPFVDSAVISQATSDIFKNTSIIYGNRVRNAYVVAAADDKWLSVVINEEVVLRYKLKIRKNYTAAK
jgi:transglutaminase/protease-like cytokinesis protein 3